jgi:hypothetical protein
MKHRLLTAIILCAVLLLSACRQETLSPTGATALPTEHIHKYIVAEKVEGSCAEESYTLMRCDCGVSYRANVVTHSPHDYHATNTVPPTATEKGYTVYTCSRCGDSYHADEIPATNDILAMTFEQYMSVRRTYSRINTAYWTVEDGSERRLRVDPHCLTVLHNAEVVSNVLSIPESLSGATLIGCNGELAFLRTDTAVIQVEFGTRKITTLNTADAILGAWLCDDYFLYYAAYDADEDELQIFMHSYLPKGGHLSIIPHIPANGTPLSLFFFPAPETNSQAVVFYTMSTKMLERIQQELADPDSPYRFDQRIQVAALWEDPDRIHDPAYANKVRVLSRTLQNEHHIAPHTCYTGVLGEGIQAQRDTTAPDPKPLPQKYRPLEVIYYHPDYTDMYPGYDFTGCIPGHYYAGNRITKELTWLYDDTLVRCEEQHSDHHSSKGQYIYYTRKDDPTKIYRMDYKGIVKDELVYQGDPNIKLDFLVISNTHDYEQLAILQGDQIYILDLQEDTCTKVYEADNIYGLWSYEYEASSKSFIVAYEGNGDGYRWHYNITTGEMKQYPNL